MYTTQGYLYDQIHWVVLGIGPIDRWNRMFYAKTIKLYKGIDNHVKFKIRNQNQKDVNVGASSFVLHILDPFSHEELLYRPMLLEDPQRGLITVTIPEEDLWPFEAKMYHYSLRMLDGEGVEHPVYVDDNYSAAGVMEIHDNAYPMIRPATEAVFGPYTANVAYSSLILQERAANTTHTAAVYLTGFTGTIEVQARLDNATQGTPEYYTVLTSSYTNADGVTPISWVTASTSFRFKITRASGSVDRILHKN